MANIYNKPLMSVKEKLLKIKSFKAYIKMCRSIMVYDNAFLSSLFYSNHFYYSPANNCENSFCLSCNMMSYVFNRTLGCINMYFTYKRDLIALKVINQISN